MNTEILSRLEAWIDALEGAGDDPDHLDAAAGAPTVWAGAQGAAGPSPWTADDQVRAHKLGERMVALQIRLGARRTEIGRELAQLQTVKPQAPAAPVFFDAAL